MPPMVGLRHWLGCAFRTLRRRSVRLHSCFQLQALEARVLISATPLGGAFAVHDPQPGDDRLVAVAGREGGPTVVVWERRSGSQFDLLAGIVTADGAAVSDPLTIAAGQARVRVFGQVDGSAVATDASGNFVVAWIAGSGVNRGLFYRLYDADGSPRSEAQKVAGASYEVSRVDVAMDADGDFVLVWGDVTSGSSWNRRIEFQLFNAAGESQSTVRTVSVPSSGNRDDLVAEGRFSIAIADDGDFVIAFDAVRYHDVPVYDPDFGEYVALPMTVNVELFFRRNSASGSARGGAVSVALLSIQEPISADFADGIIAIVPDIAMNGGGDFLIAYRQSRPSFYNDEIGGVFGPVIAVGLPPTQNFSYRRYDADGVAASDPVSIITLGAGVLRNGGQLGDPAAILTSDGRAVVGFLRTDTSSFLVETFSRSDVALGPIVTVVATGSTADTSLRLLAAADPGQFLVVYPVRDEDSNADIQARVFQIDQPDLTGAVTRSTLPPAVVAGSTTGNRGVATAQITNLDPAYAGGAIVVSVMASLDDVLGNEDDIVLGTRQQTIALAADQTLALSIPVAVPAETPEGAYRLYLHVDSGNDITGEVSEANNRILLEQTLAVAEPFVDLTVTDVNVTGPLTLVRGETAGVTGTIMNNGNVPVRGLVDIRFFARRVSDDAIIDLATLTNQRLAIQPGQVQRFGGRLLTTLDLDPDQYVVGMEVDVTDVMSDPNRTDNTGEAAAAVTLRTAFGAVAERRGVLLRMTDDDGTPVTFRLIGPGSGELVETDNGWFLQLTGTTLASRAVIVTGRGGDQRAVLAGVTVDGDLGQLVARGVVLAGDAIFAGAVRNVVFGDVGGPLSSADQHQITIDGAASGIRSNILAGRVQDLTITSTGMLGSVLVTDWRDSESSGEPDLLTASSMLVLRSGGNLQADVTLTDNVATGLRSLLVLGVLDRVTIRSAGGIGAVNVGRMVSSRVLAGMSDALAGFPVGAASSASEATIGSVVVRDNSPQGAAYVDSLIAAWSIGRARLGAVGAESGEDFGVAARQRIAQLLYRRDGQVFVRRLVTAANSFSDPVLPAFRASIV